MSTSNMSDEELDNLFRKSIGSFDPPYDPEAWYAMEKKLDSVSGGHSWWFKILFPLLLLVYICSMVADSRLTSLPVVSPPTNSARAVTASTPKEEKILSGTSNTGRSIQKKEKHNPSGKQEISVTVHPAPAPKASKNIKEKALVATKINTASPLPRRSYLPKTQEAGEVQQTAVVKVTEEQKYITGNPDKDSFNQAFSPFEVVEGSAPPILPPALLKADSAQLQTKAFSKPNPEEKSSSQNSKSAEKKAFFSSLQIAVLAAPDLTTVKFKNPDAVSANAGLLFGIPVTKKLSMVTGVIWANKVYGAKPEGFSPSSGYWNPAYLPVSIDATCRILDIPLNLRYQVLEWDKNSVSVQAGLSSYIMLKESYTYNYATYSKSVEYTNEYNHLLGVQNLSVSYARKITPLISIGVEPFVKLPLTGVGAGQIKLSSAGVFFTAGYSVQLKK